MGLGPAAVQLTLELCQRGLFRNIKSVVNIGSQEIHVELDHFENLVKAAGIFNYRRANFPGIENYPAQPRSPARPLYQMLGAENYACVDLNREFGAIAHDLNTPFSDPAHLGKYDLVTDHGSCEHAFNIAEAYRTLHRLCKVDGLILAIQQVYGGNGYYNFDRSFFEGIAAANGYKILFASYVVTPPNAKQQFHVPIASAMLDVVDWGKVCYLGMAYVLQKQKDGEFQFPYQDEYLSQVQNHYGYNIHFSVEPPGRTYVPVFDLDHVKVKTLAHVLSQRVKRRLFGAFHM